MTAVHGLLGSVLIAGSLVVVVAATWSWLAGRRSGGRLDHRSATDRAVLAVLGVVVVGGSLGVVLLITGSRPADALHLLYGPAALVALPVAIGLGLRGSGTGSARGRRDLWTAGGGLVLLGLGLRLLATG